MRISDWSSDVCSSDLSPIEASERTRGVTLTARLAPHYVEWVRQQTIAAVGEDAVYGAGLRVVTPLDPDAQAAAEAAVAEVMGEPGGPQAALVARDPAGRTDERRVGEEGVSKCRS